MTDFATRHIQHQNTMILQNKIAIQHLEQKSTQSHEELQKLQKDMATLQANLLQEQQRNVVLESQNTANVQSIAQLQETLRAKEEQHNLLISQRDDTVASLDAKVSQQDQTMVQLRGQMHEVGEENRTLQQQRSESFLQSEKMQSDTKLATLTMHVLQHEREKHGSQKLEPRTLVWVLDPQLNVDEIVKRQVVREDEGGRVSLMPTNAVGCQDITIPNKLLYITSFANGDLVRVHDTSHAAGACLIGQITEITHLSNSCMVLLAQGISSKRYAFSDIFIDQWMPGDHVRSRQSQTLTVVSYNAMTNRIEVSGDNGLSKQSLACIDILFESRPAVMLAW